MANLIRIRAEKRKAGWYIRDFNICSKQIRLTKLDKRYQEQLNLMLYCDVGVELDGVGFRLSEKVIYLDP
jgi:hypothetical protein